MEISDPHIEYNKIKTRIIDYALLWGAILGVLAYLIGLKNLTYSDSRLSYFTEPLFLLLFFSLFLFRKRISIKLKATIITLSLTIIISIDTIEIGVFSNTKILMILIPFFSVFVFNLKKTIIIYTLVITIFLVIGTLIHFGYIQMSSEVKSLLTSFSSWIIAVVLITIVAFIIIVIEKNYHEAMLALLKSLQRKNVEIHRQEQNYRQIFNLSSEAIFIHGLDGSILDVNDSVSAMYGIEKSEIKNLHFSDISSGAEGYTVNDAMEYIETAKNKGFVLFDWQAKAKNGNVFWVEISLKHVEILGEERIMALVRNVHEKKTMALQLEEYKNNLEQLVRQRTVELESANKELHQTNDDLKAQGDELQMALDQLRETQQHLVQSEKMVSLGLLAAGVAHEINNPLNFIKGGVTGVDLYIDEHLHEHKANLNEILSIIEEGVDRTSDIVQSLNHFSHSTGKNDEICDIHQIVENCLTILNNRLKNRIDIEKHFTSTDEYLVSANLGRLHQMFLNILVNAEQAIQNKGKITLECRSDGNILTVKITDTGCGMPDEIKDCILEPFYTTKAPGKGAGLGLSIVQTILNEFSGKIEFESKQNKGTTVSISLPLHKQ